MAEPPVLPLRYAPVARLGKGGGGEVWSVRDRVTGDLVALKTLAVGADEAEAAALVREAIASSGLGGVGVPRVLRFGRLPGGRPFLVRELVPGESLVALLERKDAAEQALRAVANVAAQLTLLHRAQLLHGDVKPANIIVAPDGGATLVDLGLVVAFREGGARAAGLTPRYAAPELFEGAPLTVRAEVYALGETLLDVVRAHQATFGPALSQELEAVARRATAAKPEARYPSVDELGSALRQKAPRLLGEDASATRTAWPVLGIDDAARTLVARVQALRSGGGLVVVGPPGSGRTTLLKRLSWSLEIGGARVAWAPSGGLVDPLAAFEIELDGATTGEGVVVLVDDAERLPALLADRLASLREGGAKIVVAGSGGEQIAGATLEVFDVPRLDVGSARTLVLTAAPSSSESVIEHVLARADLRPGPIRAIVERFAGRPVVDKDDVDRLAPPGVALGAAAGVSRSSGPADLGQIRSALERGHFEEAAELLETRHGDRSVELAVLRARLLLNRAEWRASLDELASVGGDLEQSGDEEVSEYFLELARAHLRAGDNAACERAAAEVTSRFTDLEAAPRRLATAVTEARAVGGLAKSFLARHDEARADLDAAVASAELLGDPRTLSIALGSLAFAHQRTGQLSLAKAAYERALGQAEAAGDAGTVATTRLNLAAIAKAEGALAEALGHLEAAVDMGRRSGRRATLRQALLNLANLDLYLGRLSRAQVSIGVLAEERAELPPQMAAQLVALEAEAAGKSGDALGAEAQCLACARAYDALGRPVDAAEAKLESIFFALGRVGVDAAALPALTARLAEADEALSGVTTHRAAVELARGRLLALGGDPTGALTALDRSVAAAIETGKRDWLVRAYHTRAVLLLDEGQRLAARRDREAALAILEETAAKLPRDLREVYWDDPTRRALRDVGESVHAGSSSHVPHAASPSVGNDRLARILEINREIAGTYDLKRLLERVTDLAIALLSAERGFVILKSAETEGQLSIHASRDQAGEDPHARFSQSIAERVIRTGEPIVTSSARDDARMADYVSVHQLLLQSVACVPITSRSSGVIGALYLETRHRPVGRFADELPLLVAMSDQVAIAIETARLVGENERRALELETANQELSAAHVRLEELLGHRTAQLAQTRRDLKTARAVLKSHFGYEGLVGTSEAMRRVYALIDRIKDTDVPVLLTGESGTGKEIIARAIHNASNRSKKPFLGLNCGAIPEHLLESELFGHVRGAFTGADRDRRGLFREATDGTILLDEIGEMPHKMQAGLLRVLQEKVVRPVGGAREEPVDTRVIAATHRDLEAMVAAGTFREDLFYRLNVIQVRVPSLRERLDDIPILIDHFLRIFAARYGRERRSVSRQALKMLMGYRWPGNVRQLENALLNAWVLSDEAELMPEDFELGEPSLSSPRSSTPGSPPASGGGASRMATSLDAHKAGERERILQALAAANWNRVRAAELVNMPRRTFYRRLREYGIQ